MNIGDAVLAMRKGARLAQPGWNGKGMWLFLVDEFDDKATLPCQPYVAMKTAQDTTVIPWFCSQSDLLAEDWENEQG